MKILVTSSTGLTGKAVVRAMATKGIEVRAMVHSSQRIDEMFRLGASETFVGDISSYNNLLTAMDGVDAIYYICPTAREDEYEIGKMAISAAKTAGLRRFVYQSVLHSIEPELIHHRQKLDVERELVNSGVCYSIVQPAPFMQNILNSKNALLKNKLFIQKFFTTIDSKNRINLLDAEDFGQCVADISISNKYEYSTLEICGPVNLSVTEMISAMEEVLGKRIGLKYISDDELRRAMSERNNSEYSIETLLRMFHHYNRGDFCGSDFIATSILNRKPTTFNEFLKRELR